MWQFSQKLKNHHYRLIENGIETKKALRGFSPSSSITFFLSMICIAIVAFLGGRHSVQGRFEDNLELNTISRVLHYNRTFAERPSAETNQAWKDLFPSQGGFFKHPTLAPKRSAFAIFHQLHCLDSIRQSYYTIHDAALLSGHKLPPADVPTMSSPVHIRHCLDLLRQSLMCRPDLTVEVKDERAGGVTGFGTVHVCRDWEQLVSWTERWEGFGQVLGGGGGA